MEINNEALTKTKLAEARAKVKLFAMDYDGTLADGEKYTRDDAVKLIEEILAHGKIPAIITGRAATAVTNFMPPLKEYFKENHQSGPVYIGGGNGTVLYKVEANGVSEVYSHGFSLQEVKNVVNLWREYTQNNLQYKSLSEKGLSTFQKYYTQDWDGIIPSEILEVGRPFGGRIFTEEAKVTFVMPKDLSLHERVVSDMQKLVGEKFTLMTADDDFGHIIKRLHEDGKMVAVKAVLKDLFLQEDQVAAFGDMPHRNDKGLLSFPYSFTNYTLSQVNQPPFILPGAETDPVGSVYNAIRYLLE